MATNRYYSEIEIEIEIEIKIDAESVNIEMNTCFVTQSLLFMIMIIFAISIIEII